jgi:hypothetical protein
MHIYIQEATVALNDERRLLELSKMKGGFKLIVIGSGAVLHRIMRDSYGNIGTCWAGSRCIIKQPRIVACWMLHGRLIKHGEGHSSNTNPLEQCVRI